MIFTMFILLQTPFSSSTDEIEAYQQNLQDTAGENGELTLQQFVNVTFLSLKFLGSCLV